jgi:hypothetical protein
MFTRHLAQQQAHSRAGSGSPGPRRLVAPAWAAAARPRQQHTLPSPGSGRSPSRRAWDWRCVSCCLRGCATVAQSRRRKADGRRPVRASRLPVPRRPDLGTAGAGESGRRSARARASVRTAPRTGQWALEGEGRHYLQNCSGWHCQWALPGGAVRALGCSAAFRAGRCSYYSHRRGDRLPERSSTQLGARMQVH